MKGSWIESTERFLREARTLQVPHPNLIQVRDFGEDGEMVYVVTDLLQEVERVGIPGYSHRLGLPGQVHLLHPLGEPDRRDIDLEFIEDLHLPAQLARSSVH